MYSLFLTPLENVIKLMQIIKSHYIFSTGKLIKHRKVFCLLILSQNVKNNILLLKMVQQEIMGIKSECRL